MYIVTDQICKWRQRKHKKHMVSMFSRCLIMAPLVLISTVGIALAAPSGGVITGGSGGIETSGSATNISQTSPRLDINWNTFSTDDYESINFAQPTSDAIALNRVIGGVPSELRGALNANGRVFILNDSGITFFATSQVNVGALLATTAMNLSTDGDSLSFSGAGYGTVLNDGSIHVSDGGFAVLAAPYVANTGFIQANLGTIQLASANDFTVDFRGDGLIGFTISKSTLDGIAEAGKALGVDNTGTLLAGSGAIGITAGAASSIVQSVVNLDGIVDASSFGVGADGGTVLVASVGDINIGGEVHADGGVSGNGGTVTTWADGTNRFESGAVITARGGDVSGDGGFIEVSGNDVRVRGTANASALNGAAGTFLIDPWDLVIANGDGSTSFTGSPSGTEGTILSTDTDPTTIYETAVESLSQGGTSVVLEADNSITMEDLTDDVLQGGSGDITMTAGTTPYGPAGLIKFNDPNDKIATTSGAITMTAADGAEGGSGTIDVGHLETLRTGADITLTAGLGGITTGNLSTGTDPDVSGFGTNNPGDIILTTTGDITTSNVTIWAENTDSASAYLKMDADGFLTTGNISLTAIDPWDNASAKAKLFAGNILTTGDITIIAEGEQCVTADLYAKAGEDISAGSVFVQAHADETSNSADAIADADLIAQGDITLTGDLTVDASADVLYYESANADANLNVNAGGSLSLTGNTMVTATANQTGSYGYDSVTAKANADLIANSWIEVTGDITVAAVATNTIQSGSGASAETDLTVDAGGDLTITGNILASAEATQTGSNASDDADADAEANLWSSGDMAVNGNIEVKAIALNEAGNDAKANASLSVATEEGDIRLTGDGFLVEARATLGTSGTDSAEADASAEIDSADDLDISGVLSITAIAVNNGTEASGGASAEASLEANAYSDITMTGVTVVTAEASSAGYGSSYSYGYGYDPSVKAAADASFNADNNVTVNGDLLVRASAEDVSGYGSGAEAFAALGVIASGGDLNITGDIDVTADASINAAVGDGYNSANAEATAVALLTGGNDVDITTGNNGTINVAANAVHEGYGSYEGYGGSGNADAAAVLVAGAGVNGNNLMCFAEELTNGYYPESDPSYYFGEGNLSITGDVKVTGTADSAYGQADAVAAAFMVAGNDTTILTDPITVLAEAKSGTGYSYPADYVYDGYDGYGYSNADAFSYLLCEAGVAGIYEEGKSGSLYITGDISSTALATGISYYNYYNADAFTGLYAADDITVRGADPLAYAPTAPGAEHARVQSKESGFDEASYYADGGEGYYTAELEIKFGGTVSIEPKPQTDYEHNVVLSLETNKVKPIEPLGPGRDPLSVGLDGLVSWATGAGVSSPSRGFMVTPDVEGAIARGVDPTTILPSPAAGGMGLSSGLDAYSVGGPDYCDQVVNGYCLPAEGGKKTK